MKTLMNIAIMCGTSYNYVYETTKKLNIKPNKIENKLCLDIWQEDLVIEQLYRDKRVFEIILNSKINTNFVY